MSDRPLVEVNGGELEHISTVYRPEGCEVVISNAINAVLAEVVPNLERSFAREAQIAEMQRLLIEAYDLYFAHGGYGKSSDATIEVTFPGTDTMIERVES